MSIPAFHDRTPDPRPAWGGVAAVLFSVVALSVIASAAIYFWSDHSWSNATPLTDPEVTATLQDIGAGQQQTASEIKAIKASLAGERADLKTLSDQFSALARRVDTLQNGGTQILQNNAVLAEQLKAIQAQMARDNAFVAEQFMTLTQMALDNASAAERLKESQEQMAGVISKASEEKLRPTPSPPPRRPAGPKRKLVAPSQARIQPQSPFQ